MPLRILIRILANNEQLVQKLSESYPMRKAAQLAVRAILSGKSYIEEKRVLEKLSPEQLQQLIKEAVQNLQNQMKKK